MTFLNVDLDESGEVVGMFQAQNKRVSRGCVG